MEGELTVIVTPGSESPWASTAVPLTVPVWRPCAKALAVTVSANARLSAIVRVFLIVQILLNAVYKPPFY